MTTYINQRFLTAVCATAGGFRYHEGTIWDGFVAPAIAYFAIVWQLEFAIPIMAGTMVFG